MPTNRQVISDIVGALRSNNIDDRISYRLALSILRDKTKHFVKQDADNRRLFKQANLWITIPCVAMNEVDINECNALLPNLGTIRKSIVEIPETYATIYGQTIRVLNLKNNVEYHQIQQEDFVDIANRQFKNRNLRYFWIDGNHIFIPDSDVEQIKVIGYFIKTEDVEKLLGNGCVKPLDLEFRCPDYLFDVVKGDTYQTLMNTFKRVVVDENPNLNTNEKVSNKVKR